MDSALVTKLDHWYAQAHYYYLDAPGAGEMYRQTIELLEKHSCRSILDVGCHHGNLLRFVRDTNTDYFGFDICRAAVARAKTVFENRPRTEFQHADWNHPELLSCSGAFDGIAFSGVLYYHQQKIDSFISRYIRRFTPKVIVVQDLALTDLSGTEMSCKLLEHRRVDLTFEFPHPEWGPDWRTHFEWSDDWDADVLKRRQILAFAPRCLAR